MNELTLNGKKYKLIESYEQPKIEVTEFIDGIQRQLIKFNNVEDLLKFFKKKNPFAITHFDGMDTLEIKLRWLNNGKRIS